MPLLGNPLVLQVRVLSGGVDMVSTPTSLLGNSPGSSGLGQRQRGARHPHSAVVSPPTACCLKEGYSQAA